MLCNHGLLQISGRLGGRAVQSRLNQPNVHVPGHDDAPFRVTLDGQLCCGRHLRQCIPAALKDKPQAGRSVGRPAHLLQATLSRGGETSRHVIPVDQSPPRREVVTAPVLVIQVVRVLPNVRDQQRDGADHV